MLFHDLYRGSLRTKTGINDGQESFNNRVDLFYSGRFRVIFKKHASH